jgi:hypothetical protein
MLRVLKWVLGFLALAAALTCALVYWRACQVPDEYDPTPLSPQARLAASHDFTQHVVLGLHNAVEDMQPFSWTLTQAQLNAYLGSLEDIAANWPSAKPQDARAALDRAGVSEPRVAIRDGRLRLMVRRTGIDKVVSVDVSLAVRGGEVDVRVEQAMVGKVRVPQSMVASSLEGLRQAGGRLRDAPSTHEAEGATARIVAAVLDGVARGSIDQRQAWPRVRVDDIEIRDGSITLRITPQPRYRARPADSPL